MRATRCPYSSRAQAEFFLAMHQSAAQFASAPPSPLCRNAGTPSLITAIKNRAVSCTRRTTSMTDRQKVGQRRTGSGVKRSQSQMELPPDRRRARGAGHRKKGDAPGGHRVGHKRQRRVRRASRRPTCQWKARKPAVQDGVFQFGKRQQVAIRGQTCGPYWWVKKRWSCDCRPSGLPNTGGAAPPGAVPCHGPQQISWAAERWPLEYIPVTLRPRIARETRGVRAPRLEAHDIVRRSAAMRNMVSLNPKTTGGVGRPRQGSARRALTSTSAAAGGRSGGGRSCRRCNYFR